MKKLFLVGLVAMYTNLAVSQEKEQPKSEGAQDLALKLANPVANLISVPFQFNTMLGVGPNNGSQLVANFQPVIPFSLGKVTLITRTIVPFIENRNIISEGSTQFGVSDVNFSAFFTPTRVGKFIWGVGPAISIPTASKSFFGYEKWAAGPSAVILKQTPKGWSYIVLVRQIWSFAGSDSRNNVNPWLINPGVAHAFKTGTSLGANFEIQGDWQRDNSTQAYLNLSAGMVSKFGKQPVSFGIGPRIPLNSDTPGDWGIRVGITFIFSK